MSLLDDILDARKAISPYIHKTPLWRSSTFSRELGRDVYIKAELFQKTGSYKPRGMIWALMSLSEKERAAGAITFSSGNAAQALAYAGSALGVKIVVVMAAKTNPTKVAATKGYGAEVILHGTPQEAKKMCSEIASERGLTYISSYDDEAVMTGHASLGCELFEELPDISAIFLGIGGGGMAGGLAKAAIAHEHPVELFGVEPSGAPAMTRSLKAGAAVELDTVNSIADGLAAPSAGAACYALVKDRFKDVFLVEDDVIIEAMRSLMQRCKIAPEPAGAAAMAGLLANAAEITRPGPVVAVISGGNLDFNFLKSWL